MCLLHKHRQEGLFSGFITGVITPLSSSPEYLVCFYYVVPVTHVLTGCVFCDGFSGLGTKLEAHLNPAFSKVLLINALC